MKRQNVIEKLKSESRTSGMPEKFQGIAGFSFWAAVGFLYCYLTGISLLVPLFLLSLALLVKALYKDLSSRPYRLLNLAFLYVIIVFGSYLVVKQGGRIEYIPFSVLPMLAALLFHELAITFVLTAAAAVTIASFTAQPEYIGVMFMACGIVSSLLVHGARRRNTIISAGFIIGLLQAVSLALVRSFNFSHPYDYLVLLLNGIASGIIVTGILPVFEFLFGTITNIKLLELADFSNPLLNRLMLEAPGTYHHSLIVGNLSEAACKAIGANSLLARIGAYYHDVGKLGKPAYFTENQAVKSNIHESLAPNMSKLLIMNHVKEGTELAKQYRLDSKLIDFIQQHHGTSLVYYFYRRALENSEPEQEVAEEGFRYPGPKPSTKEIAIVLLADSVEAATRALKDPTPAAITDTVHKIINNKFIDGQLDACDLTLKDLETIASVFSHILSGMYHSRITYPEAGSENKGAHPQETDPRQPGADSQDRP